MPERLAVLERSSLVDMEAFGQILEMDDDEEEFSRSIVFDFFEQAEQTLNKMDEALAAEDLRELKELGHFLKGSSATLGLVKIRDDCEKIQNYGDGKDETGTLPGPAHEKVLHSIGQAIADARSDFELVERALRSFYAEE